MRAHRAGAGALIVAALAGCGSSGPSDADVVRDWSDAVRERDYAEAADLFALPSVIENGITVRATRRAQVDVFNRSLSCGAILKDTEPANDGRLIATFRLVDGAGGPGSRCSGEAHVRVHVVKGHITEWIRQDRDPPPDSRET